jgi:hypothetical protein
MANPWIHCKVTNRTSYELRLVDKSVSGSKNFRWNTWPPDKIAAHTGEAFFDAMADDLVWGNVSAHVTYEADIDGFSVRISLGGTANDHPAGGRGPSYQVSKDKIINVYQRTDPSDLKLQREFTVYWTLREWPDVGP